MPWIPHLMVLDDDPRVLDSLIPSLPQELARTLARHDELATALRRGGLSARAGAPLNVHVTAHGYESERVASYQARSPHHLHLHLVREQGGRFDLARRLLNDQLFAVVVSDLRFSDDAGGQRAGQLFVDEISRVHPECEGLLYSAYPRPEGFPVERFVRKGIEQPGEPRLVDRMIESMERYLERPSVSAFVSAIADQGLVYQSDAFGRTLAQVFSVARLLGGKADESPAGRATRPLPCILLDGESGTGKRGLAHLVHAASDRRSEPFALASCSELTNETLLRSILFGHKRGAFTDAREDRAGLISTAGRGVLLLDDFHRLPPACSAILHSFLEDGHYSRLGEEEKRRRAECLVILTVETSPWRERRTSGELPLAFLARVERLPVEVPPLRSRPDDIEAQARWLTQVVGSEVGADLDLEDDAIDLLRASPFADSNSRELRNLIERAIFRYYREADSLDAARLEAVIKAESAPSRSPSSSTPAPVPTSSSAAAQARAPQRSTPAWNEWQRRLRQLASKILRDQLKLSEEEADAAIDQLFDETFPAAREAVEAARVLPGRPDPIPLPLWSDLWRCFAVSWLGGPTPAEKSLGVPANTLRQWINDREAR